MTDKPKKRLLEQLKLDGIWDNLEPNHRRAAVVVGGISTLFLAIAMMPDGGDSGSASSVRDNVKRSVLTDSNTRSIGIDALNAKVKAMESANVELQKKVARQNRELEDFKRRRGNDPDMSRKLALLEGQMKGLTDRAKTLGWEVADIKEGYFTVPGEDQAPDGPVRVQQAMTTKPAVVRKEVKPVDLAKRSTKVEEGLNSDPNYYFRTAPVRPAAPVPTAGAPDLRRGAIAGGTMNIYTTDSIPVADAEEKDPSVYLPTGTIMSGVLMNGLNAPTGRNARKDPFPVLVRIQHDAILPNQYTADVKECFATLSGYGDLSSERAYLRGESFSCVTHDGRIIEESFPAYAVGLDGSAGIRGRVVSRAGSLIGKTALAGFAAGVAEAFDTSPVPVIQTGGNVGSSQAYQNNFNSDAARHGASSGASAALSRLAEYYQDMTDQLMPIIELDPGIKVEIILSKGFALNVKDTATLQVATKE